jgi:hypothetical protein
MPAHRGPDVSGEGVTPDLVISGQTSPQGLVCLGLVGELDMDSGPRLESVVQEWVDAAGVTRLEIDMGRLAFIDSTASVCCWRLTGSPASGVSPSRRSIRGMSYARSWTLPSCWTCSRSRQHITGHPGEGFGRLPRWFGRSASGYERIEPDRRGVT